MTEANAKQTKPPAHPGHHDCYWIRNAQVQIIVLLAASLIAVTGLPSFAEEATPSGDLQKEPPSLSLIEKYFKVANVRTFFSANGRISNDVDPVAWSRRFLSQFVEKGTSGRDVIIYVHGYHTEFARLLILSRHIHSSIKDLERYETQRPEPLYVHFAWPGDFSLVRFSSAQNAASGSAQFLHALLDQLASTPGIERTIVIAHSLGAHVTMEALYVAYAAGTRDPIMDALVLVQGAIPAVSIRSWRSEIETRFPSLEVYSLVYDDIEWPEPITTTYESGFGRYYFSSRLAKQLIVTTARWDESLRTWFAVDELHAPFERSRPNTMPVPGRIFPDGEVKVMAIGTPFPDNPVYDIWQPVKHPMADWRRSDRWDEFDRRIELQPDPTEILLQSKVKYDFEIGHPNFHHVPLELLIRPTEWHSPLADEESRKDLLDEIWDRLDD